MFVNNIYSNDIYSNVLLSILRKPKLYILALKQRKLDQELNFKSELKQTIRTVSQKYYMFKKNKNSLKVTHNTCSLHLASNFQNSSKHTKPSIENSTSLW